MLKQITQSNIQEFARFLTPESAVKLLSHDNILGIGATEGTAVMGIAVTENIPGAVLLLELFVDTAHRRKGAGAELVDFCCEYAGCQGKRMLCIFPVREAAEPMLLLMQSISDIRVMPAHGATFKTQVQTLPEFLASQNTDKLEPILFLSLPLWEQRQFQRTLLRQGILHLRDATQFEGRFLREFSLCMKKDSQVVSCVLVENMDSTSLLLSFVYCHSSYRHMLPPLLAELRKRLLELTPEGCTLYVSPTSEVTTKLVDKLMPQKELVEQFYTAEWAPPREG